MLARTRKKIEELFFGKAIDPNDPSVHHGLRLVAFLAWVGLGADGLSSACYGPEATFKALGEYRHLAPWLALATIVTVSILSAAYSSTISAFPSGGGGYTVASSTLGRYAGMVCGCALVIDYVLTVAISVAAGADALFSFFPKGWHEWRYLVVIGGVAFLMVINFRGVKDSIMVLLPIFLLFLVTHAALILLGLYKDVPAGVAPPAGSGSLQPLGMIAAVRLLLKAYSHGAGTYTGIEAISNSLSILKEPRVQTARKAMLYMAVSLSVVAGGLLMGYLNMDVASVPGKTFNAVLAERVFGTTGTGRVWVGITLFSEATLLFCAAQAGFIAGPRLLASLAVDSWFPRRFARLSDRLVVSNGIFLIGVGGLGAILVTRGHVDNLVVIYSFSVFVTFLLSQVGMVRYWFTHREQKGVVLRGLVSVLAAVLSATILGALFMAEGARYALYALGSILVLSAVCVLVRAHYRSVFKRLQRLNPIIQAAETDPYHREPKPWDKTAPTAVFLVSGYNGAGLHTLMGVQRIFPDYFKQLVFISVGQVDFDRFKGQREVENLKGTVETGLQKYKALAEKWGFAADYRVGMGVDLIDELEELSVQVGKEYTRAVYFAGDLVFTMPSVITRFLHARTGEELQRRFRERGLPLIVMPIRI